MDTLRKTWQGGLVGKVIIGCGALIVLGCLCSIPLGLLGALIPSERSEATARPQIIEFSTATPSPIPPVVVDTDTPTPLPADTPAPLLLTDTPEPLPPDTPFPPADTALPPPPTDTPLPPPPTDTPLPPPPTDTPAPAVPAGPQVVIVGKDKRVEYVDIQNVGGAPQDLNGWHLLSEKGPQDCPLSGVLGPGQTLRIWAQSSDADKGGFNCGYDGPIWNNSETDFAVLYDAAGAEIDRR